MNRRKFLKIATPLAISPLLINGAALKSFATPSMLLNCTGITERTLVIVQMKGGNDALNMIVPIDQYVDYAAHRPTIAIPDTSLITLDSGLASNKQLGLHPIMTGIKDLYDQGKANIIQSVGYPSQSRSHFKGTDLWLTGGDGNPANFNIDTGWMGRYLDFSFPDLAGAPSLLMPDPLGIELGDTEASVGFHSHNLNATNINLAKEEASSFYTLVSSIGGLAPANIPLSDYGDELQYVINVQNSTNVYAQRISDVFNAGANSVTVTYPDTDLANQLKTVARLISGGSQTKIFLVTIDGFDTHSNQVDSTTTSVGKHAGLLDELSGAIKAFHDDLAALSLEHRVTTVTFSEFGRKVIENGSFGTDHGTFAPMMVFGSAIAAGVTGTNPILNNVDGQGAFAASELQHDYRRVFTTLMQDWLGASDNALAATQFSSFVSQKLPLIGATAAVAPTCYIDHIAGVPSIKVQIEALLEGAFDATLQAMRTDLLDNGLLPLTQPFNIAPWNYMGTETLASLNDFPTGTVDWVLLEIRDGADSHTLVEQKAALIRSDGKIIDIDGNELIKFYSLTFNADYYLVVRARNHLAIMSNVPVTLPNNVPFDLTRANNVKGTDQVVMLDPGTYGLRAGDYNGDGVISVSDFNRFQNESGLINTYTDGDGTMDGNVTVNDFNAYLPNSSWVAVEELRY